MARDYAATRPHYPAPLYRWLAEVASGPGPVWDAATGNGQAALGLADEFPMVVASDASAAQLRHAPRHPRVHYVVATAEASALRATTFRLVTVAQAAHWLELPGFFSQAATLLRPGGVVALWSYALAVLESPANGSFRHFAKVTLAGHWPTERRLVDEGYRGLTFPAGFEELTLPGPAFDMRAWWDLGRLLGYVRTWSGTRRLVDAGGAVEVERFESEMAEAWGEPSAGRMVRWPLSVRAARLKA